MGANDGAVNQAIFHVRVVGKVDQHPFPGTVVAPANKSPVNRIPFAIFGGQQSPLGTTPTYPENGFHKTATGAFIFADIDIRVGYQEGMNPWPLIILELYTIHEPILLCCLKCQQNLDNIYDFLQVKKELPSLPFNNCNFSYPLGDNQCLLGTVYTLAKGVQSTFKRGGRFFKEASRAQEISALPGNFPQKCSILTSHKGAYLQDESQPFNTQVLVLLLDLGGKMFRSRCAPAHAHSLATGEVPAVPLPQLVHIIRKWPHLKE
jgi:hypothetical protein